MLTSRSVATCSLVLAAALAAGRPAVAADDAASAKEKEAKLIAVLTSDEPAANKAITCKQLAIYGSKDAVPALAALLPDKDLASWARIALEAIPDPAADEALRHAAGKLQGRLLVGVINSIGVRRDAKAVGVLVERLGDADAQVASAAAEALGRVGGAPAAKALQQALTSAPAAVRAAVAEGCVLCAEPMLAQGKQDEAARIYDAVRAADVPKNKVIEATRGAILARGPAGLPLLVEQLRSADKAMFAIGLQTARELGGPEVAKAVANELGRFQPPSGAASKVLVIKKAQYGAGDQWVDVTDKLAAAVSGNVLSVEASNNLAGDPAHGKVKELRVTYTLGGEEKSAVVPENQTLEIGQGVPEGNPRQIVLLYALGDLGQPVALAAVLDAAKNGSWGARVAAARVLGQIGDASAVPVLVAMAQSGGDLGETASESLAELKGEAVDAAIAGGLREAKGQARAVLVQVVGRRGIRSAVPTLLEEANSANAEVRLAAIGALGQTVGFDELGLLVERFVKPKDAQEAEAARNALFAACTRMPDRNATAEKLVAAMGSASADGKAVLVALLAEVGGQKALEGVAAAARSGDDSLQDAATRVLGEWMTPDVAPVLLDLAKSTSDEKYKIRALRGYLRVARQMRVPLADRIAMCREASKLCQRNEEKKLVLEVLRRYPAAEGLPMALSHLGDAALKADACAAVVAIGEKLVATEPAAAADAMKKVLEAGADPKVTARAKAVLDQARRKQP